ncbi:caspase family protein [Flavobacterium amniphilum]|uniref:caspase family protein n=1 Tax=Flavobacterium amniphilum TaxID=1834035 RepID=UPI002029C5B3|nr:caspase family protein [Flavobacterium amniphilum]MCL9805064.1 caspase family protein [Flavobacterium amniphilum]
MAKKAVIIGINDYAPIGAGGPDLNGCIPDARDMANTLVICGFSPSDIRILTNQNATKNNIITYIKWLLTGCKSGDSLVLYYSGHGTRVANIGTDLELDGLDEAICPHDYATAGFLRDDDFKSLFKGKVKKGVSFDVIFDCCHSGTGTRKMNMGGIDGMFMNETPRFIPPMLEDEFYFNFAKSIESKSAESTEETKVTIKSLNKVPDMNHVLWAGCKDNQVSMEGDVSGITRGYFTYNLCKILRATTGNITRELLDSQIANSLSAMGAAQINQTEGKSTKLKLKIFE